MSTEQLWADELEPWLDLQMRLSPKFRAAYFRFAYSEPLPLKANGLGYHRRQKRRKR